MRLKAIILALLFIFGGSGISVDIATCCDSIAGISLGFSKSHEQHSDNKSCCPSFKMKKQERQCCDEINFQTQINSTPAVKTAGTFLAKLIKVKAATLHALVVLLPSVTTDRQLVLNNIADHNYPVPILIKKRVLQI